MRPSNIYACFTDTATQRTKQQTVKRQNQLIYVNMGQTCSFREE